MVGPLTAFMRGDNGVEADAGVLLVANTMVNIELIAIALGKRDAELPPVMPGEED